MTAARLSELKSVYLMSKFFGVPESFIIDYANSTEQKGFYQELKLAKHGKHRRGEFRIVYDAHVHRLSSMHRSIAMVVANSVIFGDHVQGFLRGRSTRTNAQHHLAPAVILHADIRNFFDAITVENVARAFVRHGMPTEMAQLLAQCATIDGILRQGTRCSPILANLVCQDLDQAMLELAASLGCAYTRYADDMTFSGDAVPADEQIRHIIRHFHFELRDDRCFRQRRGRCQFVTGLCVVDSKIPRLPKRLKRRLRLIMYYIKNHGLSAHFERLGSGDRGEAERWLQGMLQYAVSIEPKIVRNWIDVYESAISDEQKS